MHEDAAEPINWLGAIPAPNAPAELSMRNLQGDGPSRSLLPLWLIAKCMFVCRFGIPCVTVDGKRHSNGALEGGYRSPDALRCCLDKLNADTAAAELARARDEAAAAEAATLQCERRLQSAMAHEESLERLHEELQRAERAHNGSVRQLRQLTAQTASAEARCCELQELVAARCSAGSTGQGDQHKMEAARARLQARVTELTAAAEMCRGKLEVCADLFAHAKRPVPASPTYSTKSVKEAQGRTGRAARASGRQRGVRRL